MPDVLVHPGHNELLAFHHGKLAVDAASSIAEHVGTCSDCQQRVDAIPDDPLLKMIRPLFRGAAAVQGLPPDSWLPEELIDHPRYRLVKWLGAGGMGVVFHAEHKVMQRPVALKIIHRKLTDQARPLARFQREIRSVAMLSHPNVVAAYDAEQVGDLHLLVMEYVDGVSLARWVERQGRLPIAQACLFAREAALGLQHAHERGLIHRDVKPQNLMVTRQGQVKVLDLGLAALADADQAEDALTVDGQMLGTPDYVAPEQVLNARAVDARADVYSLGCTLYFLLTGQAPYPDGTVLQKVAAQADGSPMPVPQLRSDLPPGLAAVVERMMAKEPGQRYQTAGAVAEALRPFTTTDAPAGRRRQLWLIGGMAATMLLAVWLCRSMIPVTAAPPAGATPNAEMESPVRGPEQPPGAAAVIEKKDDKENEGQLPHEPTDEKKQEPNDPKKVNPRKVSSGDGKDFVD